MAYKPSARQSQESLKMDLDIRPVMNLMVVLIPLLLQGAEWVKLGAIEINAPPSKSGGKNSGEQQDQKEEEKVIGLKLAVTGEGITIATASAMLAADEGDADGPTVPLNSEGKYDYELLKTKLIEIKKLIAGKGFKDEDRAVITAGKDIEYQNIVDLIDNIQVYENEEGNQKALFPQVNFGSIIQ
jgi:biopolymer transport protein ExbD